MSIGSETAEQMTREAIQISEAAAKLAALGAKNLAALCLALANENQKLRGKTHMNALLRSGKELRVFDLKEQDLAAFRREAKKYGILFSVIKEYEKDPDHYNYTYTVIPKYWENGKTVEDKEYRVVSLPSGLNGNPIGIPRGYSTDASIVNTSLDTLKLTLIDTVKSSAFDGSSGVRTKDGYYELAENIGVYVSEQNRFVSLQTAKSNYTSFRVYANKTAENGGKIRVIVAS